MNFRTFLAAATAIGLVSAVAAAPAHATVFSGTFSLVDTSNPASLNFSSPAGTPAGTSIAFSWDLGLNKPLQIDAFTTYSLSPKQNCTLCTDSDSIKATFSFTNPAVKVVTQEGDVSETIINIFGHYSNGSIIWDNSALGYANLPVSFSTGDAISMQLGNGIFGNFNGSANQGALSLTVTETKVPEPMSIALLGGGLVGLGTVVSRRRARSTAGTASA